MQQSFKKKRSSKPYNGGQRNQGGFNNRRNTKNKQKPSNLNPALLQRKASDVEVIDYESSRTFEDMPLSGKLKQCLSKKGFEKPTEIQDKTLESLLEGRDILGIAQTGTGKTGAFLMPIIEQLQQNRKKSFALVVVPTRELAVQVDDEFKSMTKGMGFFSACLIGGTNINIDIGALRRSVHLVVATPGRLLDLEKRRSLDLRQFNTLVLDEFDRMLDMGFINDVKSIIKSMQQRKQTMLFSATLDKTQQQMIDQTLHNPVTVKVSTGEATGDHIDQEVIKLRDGEDKLKVLIDMVSDSNFEKVLVFDETKRRVSKLCENLNKAGISSDQIHGNKSQTQRQKALSKFKDGKVKVLVATDVAARGIDVSDVTHVINYQIPMTFDSYIHRIGRTGRAGKAGKAFTFVN
jgi:ATP-dependent RNA helicase RhlE